MLLAGETDYHWLTELALVSSWPRADFRLSLFAHRTCISLQGFADVSSWRQARLPMMLFVRLEEDSSW